MSQEQTPAAESKSLGELLAQLRQAKKEQESHLLGNAIDVLRKMPLVAYVVEQAKQLVEETDEMAYVEFLKLREDFNAQASTDFAKKMADADSAEALNALAGFGAEFATKELDLLKQAVRSNDELYGRLLLQVDRNMKLDVETPQIKEWFEKSMNGQSPNAMNMFQSVMQFKA